MEENGKRNTPSSLSGDAPIRSVLNHRAEAIVGNRREEGNRLAIEWLEREYLQFLENQILEVIVNVDEELLSTAVDHRSLGTPVITRYERAS